MKHTGAYYKQELYDYCVRYVKERIHTAQTSMQHAQEAANAEEKSSAGDKYETGRAMMQLERDKAAEQLSEAQKLKSLLEGIPMAGGSEIVRSGSLIFCDDVNFYIAISVGKILIDDLEFFVIAPNVPIAQLLLGKKVGEAFAFNGKTRMIRSIF